MTTINPWQPVEPLESGGASAQFKEYLDLLQAEIAKAVFMPPHLLYPWSQFTLWEQLNVEMRAAEHVRRHATDTYTEHSAPRVPVRKDPAP